jgi:membrane dipeptidase
MELTHEQIKQANKGFHPLLEQDLPYIFIDSCMQAWPDADYANAHRHGVTAYAVTAWRPDATLDQAVEEGMFWHLVARKHPNCLVVETADDIRRAKREGRAAFILAAQGGDFIANKLHRVEAMQRLGLRMLLPAYNRSNQICDGALDRTASGLTRFGELVVDECNRVGVLLDCTHIGKRASLEIIARSSQPCVFSHSNPSAVVPNPRNIDDEQIRACVERGGVIGLAPWGPLVMKSGTSHWPTVDDFIDLIDYVAQLTGRADCLGIGTDMSLGTYPDHAHDPWGVPDYADVASRYSELITADVRSPMRALDGWWNYAQVVGFAERLGARGYTDEQVRGILGENYLRVFEQVWGTR